jgi:hypothetical protein
MKAYRNLQAEENFPLNKTLFITSLLRESQRALNDDQTVPRMKQTRLAVYSFFTAESVQCDIDEAGDLQTLLLEMKQEVFDESYRNLFLLTIVAALSDYTTYPRGGRFCDDQGSSRLLCTDMKLKDKLLELIILAIRAERDIKHHGTISCRFAFRLLGCLVNFPFC